MLYPSLGFRNNPLPLSVASAAAAYSLRYINPSYSGSVVRVRRSSDNAVQNFTPTGITDGTLAAFCGANNGFVTIFYDQSGNTRDLSQSNTAEQPKIYDSVTGVITDNGKPAIQFISASHTRLTYSSAIVISQPFTSLAVAKDTGVTDTANLLFDSNLANTRCFLARTTYFWLNAEDTGTVFISQPDNSNQNLFYALFDGASSELALNGGAVTTGDIGSNALNGLTMGGIRPITVAAQSNFAFNGYIQEFIIYDSDQSANRTKIEQNVNAYYGIY